jgi:hypothetical protein
MGGDLRPSTQRSRLVDVLETGDEFFGEGFAGLGPEEAAGDAAVFLDQEGEREELFDILLNVFLGEFVEGVVFEGFEDPWSVEAEVDEDVAVLLEAGGVEGGAEAEEADDVGLQAPGGFEAVDVFVAGCGLAGPEGKRVGVVVRIFVFHGAVEAVVRVAAGVGGPELPGHFELVGHVVVKLLGGLGDGGLDDGFGGVGLVICVCGDVNALVDGRLGEVDGVGGGCGDAFRSDRGEMAEDADERGGEGLQAEVRVPEAEVEAVGHGLL